MAEGLDFTIEEDNDSGHGTLNLKNPVARWKKDYQLN